MQLPGALFSPSSKNKKDSPQENFLYSNIKKFLVFSQKKVVLVFQEMEAPKKFPIFQETELSYIPGNRNPEKLLIFQERTSMLEK